MLWDRQSPTGNKVIHNSCHDVNDVTAQIVNNPSYSGNGYGGHGIYMDSATGLLDAEQNLVYRVSALAFNMSNGPQIPSQPNTSKNNIFAFWMQNMAGVQACAPASNVNQFNFTNNITLADHNPTGAGTNVAAYTMQKAPGAYFFSGSPTVIQNWANNFYYLR